MNNNGIDKKEFIKIMTALAGNFGDSLDDLTIELWYKLFQKDGITITDIRQGAESIIKTRKYKSMPTYAEMMEHIKGRLEDIAQVQADLVITAVRDVGAEGQPKFDDPVTAYLMSHVWRWRQFASGLLDKEIPFFIRDFKAAYQSYSRIKTQTPPQINPPEKLKKLIGGIGEGGQQ